MTPRRILLIAAVAAGLAIAAAVLSRLEHPAAADRPLAKIKAADLAKLEITRAGQDIVLEKKAGLWRLTAPIQDEAESGQVERLEEDLLSLALGTEVSRDPSGYPDYGLADDSATRVRVYSAAAAAPCLDGYFGKDAIGGAVYFRKNREPAVYLAAGVSSGQLQVSADGLRSRSLFALPLSELRELRVERSGAFRIEKSSGGWKASGRALSADRAAGIVLAAVALRFAAFAAPEERNKNGWDKPALTLTASGGGRTEKVLLGKAAAGRRWAKSVNRAAAGFVSQADADALLKLLE